MICLDTKSPDDQVMKNALANIGKELGTARDAIHYALGKDWDTHVGISLKDEQVANDVVALKVDFQTPSSSGSLSQVERVHQLVEAMDGAGLLNYRLSKFCGQLMDLVLVPLMMRDARWINESDDTPNTLEIKFHPDESSGQNSTCDGRPEPKEVMSGIDKVLVFLSEKFADKDLISRVGMKLGQAFCDELIKNCLAPSVPNKSELLPTFSIEVVDHAHMLQQSLQEMGFLQPEETSITDYLANTETLVIDKRCQELLSQARTIMQSQLLTTVVVGGEKDDLAEPQIEETLRDMSQADVDAELEALPLPESMQDLIKAQINIFAFPQCEVSQHILDLFALVEETVREAGDSPSSHSAVRLFGTARSIVRMYSDILPVAHKHLLDKVPQASALAFNNCMFLAHKAMTLGLEMASSSCSVLPANATLADLTLEVRQSGSEIFLAQMRAQRDQLRAILRDSSGGLGQLCGDSLLPQGSAEKCVRQVAHQMMHLRNVWGGGVLPESIYKRAVGTVFNSVIEELIGKVVALEDIAADSANQISALYMQVEEQGPKVFDDKRDVVVYVKKWAKFRELILILNASLREIDDRWSSGKGPMAMVFQPEEVKRLIRALFQNTDRRSQVLSRIKL